MTQPRLMQDPFYDVFYPEFPPNPRMCGICHELFAEEWMAQRCEAQGLPLLAYRVGELIKRKNDAHSLLLVRRIGIHHATGVKCHVEGPCPHDATYYCYRLYADWFGPDRAWVASAGDMQGYHRPDPGHEVVARLTAPWGVITEMGGAETYMAGPAKEEDWQRLWQLWDEMKLGIGRRAGRRLLKD